MQRKMHLFALSVASELKKKKNYLFIFLCAGSSLPLRLFFSCGERGLLCSCGVRTSHCGGFSCWEAWALGPIGLSTRGSQALEHRLDSCGAWAQLLQHVGSSWTRDWTHVSCTGRGILHHGSPRHYFFHISFSSILSFFRDPKDDLEVLLSLCLKLSTSFSVCFLGCWGWA